MRFLFSAFMAAVVVAINCEAFVPTSVHSKAQGLAFVHGRVALSRQAQLQNQKRLTITRLTSDDVNKVEEEEEDEGSEEESDDDEPLSKGIDSVSWLPSVIGAKSESISGIHKDAEILPLFPLGGLVYTPNSEHVLNIFEPRYRQMYNDILMNGTKRFVVTMSHPTESGRFAQTGVLFELQDLKEVSEQTDDQIKYICNHKVTGRVNLRRILNPEVWQSRETYLKAEGTIVDDTGKDEKEPETNDVYGVVAAFAGDSQEEKAIRESFKDLVQIQHELQEDVRFTKASVSSLAVKPGPGEDGLWQTIRLWQNYADQRLMMRQAELQEDFQKRLQEYLKKERGMKDGELPNAIGFQDLSPSLQEEVKELQQRMAVELQPLVLESTLTMQKILEAKDHKARCKLLQFFIDAERKRLRTKKSLKSMFASDGGAPAVSSESSMPAVEKISGESSIKKAENPAKPRSIFTDEPDAFQ